MASPIAKLPDPTLGEDSKERDMDRQNKNDLTQQVRNSEDKRRDRNRHDNFCLCFRPYDPGGNGNSVFLVIRNSSYLIDDDLWRGFRPYDPGKVFCCVGALAIAGSLHHIDKDLLGWWLCERQVKSGGLNGPPEKLPDVCYSWWVLSSLIIIDRVHWIDKDKLARFILDCQDKENVYHTYFGVAGLSLLEYPGIKAIDPAYALPVDVVNRIFFNKKDSSA
ncbi:hypothetical protein C5167_019018 [Papaver somniferum]|uniref:Geranylgeranyl transferase type II subunit beta n=1 Tax=Papaver somniferum TaxID=3469 RepID=A0A4Y7IPJ2_PAPSO|nr:hypothetical protein C5167_019018 [Papaver somniferum]